VGVLYEEQGQGQGRIFLFHFDMMSVCVILMYLGRITHMSIYIIQICILSRYIYMHKLSIGGTWRIFLIPPPG
jgi:hypothetical protein